MVTAPLITPGLINLPSAGRPGCPRQAAGSADLPERRYRAAHAGAGRQPGKHRALELVSKVRARITADTPVVIAADGKVPLRIGREGQRTSCARTA